MDVLVYAGQLVVMGGEQRFAADVLADILYHSTGDAHAVKGRSAAADLIKNDQAVPGGMLEDLGHLGHLNHKGGLSGSQVVRSTHAGEDRIHNTEMSTGGGHEAADLSHQGDQGVLAHISGFTGHVGAGDEQHAVLVLVQQGVVGDK